MSWTRDLTRCTAIVLLGLTTMGACSSDDSDSGAATTPIAGTLTGEFGGEGCSAAGVEVAVVISGTGEMGDLGEMKVDIDATAVCASTQGLDRVTDITGSYTDANGDVLNFTGTGATIVAAEAERTLTFTATDTFTGGTGRFAGATGQETVTYLHDFNNMVLTLVVEGSFST